jgi:uncharacterized protein
VDNGQPKPEPPLRAVLDTNVMLNGLFGRGTLTATIYGFWVTRVCMLVTSRAILREVAHVLHSPHIQRRFQPREETITRFLRLVFRKAILTQDLYTTARLTADPTDNKFLACALEGQADYIVSRDPHLLNLKHFHAMQIVEPPAFVRAKLRGARALGIRGCGGALRRLRSSRRPNANPSFRCLMPSWPKPNSPPTMKGESDHAPPAL